jgi:hypothetical protein
LYITAQGRPELAKGAPWVAISTITLTPQALHNSQPRLDALSFNIERQPIIFVPLTTNIAASIELTVRTYTIKLGTAQSLATQSCEWPKIVAEISLAIC